jgi:hypothetical protein
LLLCSLIIPACSTESILESGGGGGGKGDSVADQVVVNEIAAHPEIDVNGDGVINTADEYIEIVNGGDSDVDMAGVTVADGNSVRFTFPDGAVLKASGAIMLMARSGDFAASAQVDVFSAGRLGLNNDHDSITIKRGDAVLEKHGYGMSSDERRSWNRVTDGDHEMIFQLVAASPGTRQDGSHYGASILSDDEAKSVLVSLDDECPDTFCGGDFSFFLAGDDGSLSCKGTGNCTVNLLAKPAVDDKFPSDVLDGAGNLTTVDPFGTFTARVTGSRTKDTFSNDQEVFVNIECNLSGDYFTAADVVDASGDPTDAFRDNLLDCLGGDNGIDFDVLGQLPTFGGLLTQFEREQLLSALHEECPDTFCGGDFTYFLDGAEGSFQCDNDGRCVVGMTVTPFDDAWADNPTDGLSADQLTSTAPDGSFTVTATGSTSASGETRVQLECALETNMFDPDEVYDRDSDEASDELRDMFLSCLSDAGGAEQTVLSSLPLQ